ncbi:MAG TPA: UDP-N-acetylmuramoyl-L-alanyl-D-glutamate--2,6-diaminopimelate ligase [Phycisphaerae bacterium]|nr:UDP-N-acetylmuramoyl-L-alanyl-D-glutamate--2,6-diaminopimelate ligase [Phycisphaerae bacterium]
MTMRFSELMKRTAERGLAVTEVRDGKTRTPTPWSDGSGGNDPEIRGVSDDSRKVKPGDVFVARSGTKADGTKFIVDAINRGAVAIVGEMTIDIEGVGSARVDDVNRACALLAHEMAGNPTAGMKVIGVTGTKGKTTVAYLLRSVLKAAGTKVGMIGTVEIDDGQVVVPAEMTTPGAVELVELFSRMHANGVTHCVMEVSSHALHQQRTAGIDFAVGIFTNLTGDHLDYHGTMEEYAAAKKILFDGLGKDAAAVVNVDDAWGEKMVRDCKAQVLRYHVEIDLSGHGLLKAADRPQNGWSGLVTKMTSGGMVVYVSGPEIETTPTPKKIPYLMQLDTPLVGKHNAYNLVSAYAAMYGLGFSAEGLFEGTKALLRARGAPGRLQRIEWEGDFQVFVDYAHTHDALANVLAAVRATMGGDIGGTPMPPGRLICVFGCGGDRDRTKRPKMGRIAEALADRVIVTSDNPRTEEAGAIIEEICAGFSEGWRRGGKISVEADRRAAIRMAIEMAEAGDVVLIAGKGHENYQIIGTTKHHFDDVEEAAAAMADREKLSANAHK